MHCDSTHLEIQEESTSHSEGKEQTNPSEQV